jgi:hypothetical protein
MAQLIIITRNHQPEREASHPRTWFLNTQHGRAVKLAVTHIGNQPKIKEKRTAA